MDSILFDGPNKAKTGGATLAQVKEEKKGKQPASSFFTPGAGMGISIGMNRMMF